MQRITITLDEELMAEIDLLMGQRGYQNRSEAIRDLARAGLQQIERDNPASTNCVAAVVYVYDHGARELAKRLVNGFHARHDLSLATLHAHLDHDRCMEVAVLKGNSQEVKRLAENIIAERGVRHGRVVVIPAEIANEEHDHGGPEARHSHIHPR
jgi:CopG family nickel-responsive transcriptional regulator